MSGKTIQARIEGSIQARIATIIDQALNSAIDSAVAKALGDSGSTETLKSNLSQAASSNGAASANSAVQDLVDVARRAVRLARTGNSALSKKERKVARNAIKAVKGQFQITAGSTDVWSRNGC